MDNGNGIVIEFNRRISTHESDLVVGSDDVVDEFINVECNNMTSQRVSINKFIDDLPNKKNNGALEREFNVYLIIFFQLTLNRPVLCKTNVNVSLFDGLRESL